MARSVTISRFASTASFTPGADGAPGQPAADAPRKKLEVPEQLGSVKLIRPLGEGGMGVVWLGRDEILHRDVAVKFLLDVPHSGDDPNFAAFLQGARAAAATSHPGLNEVFHADITGPSPAAGTSAAPAPSHTQGVPYLVMEYIDGPSVAEMLKVHGPLMPAAVRAILRGACEAVAALHDHEVIHRDIKPANIMVNRDGRVVVTDFGLACPRPSAAFGASAGHLAGTPAYMAPEMFEGIVSARTDVYALGITAYQLLSGKLPFEGSVSQIRTHHRETPLDHACMAELHVPEALVDAIERAANKNVLFRPKTARHVLDLFEDAFKAAGVGVASPAELSRLARGDAAPADPQRAGTRHRDSNPELKYYDTISTLAAGKRKIAENQPKPRVASDDWEFGDGVPPTPPPAPAAPPQSNSPSGTPETPGKKSGFSSWLKRLLGKGE